ncbi:MAG TPA: substrate-binding domain-containing protein [Longilinea sp.]|nr:substrate-binding domain-containing protein [Longilinea sp.]
MSDPIYQQIVKALRQKIMDGELKPGERLPTVREATQYWKCTPGTIQRAYAELAHLGFVVSRAGQGTTVAGGERPPAPTSLRTFFLINQAEEFLYESLAAGYKPEDVILAVSMAMDRWRAMDKEQSVVTPDSIRFVGSHDMAISWLAGQFNQFAPGVSLTLRFTGSLGGLVALASKTADISGVHLWDQITGEYNKPFIQRILPGQKVALLRLAERNMGIMTTENNPLDIHSLTDLQKSGVHFLNRQPGSGTRVWLDSQLQVNKIDPDKIKGYDQYRATHSFIAEAIATGKVNAGLGLECYARLYNLAFIPLTIEPYDLVIPEETFTLSGIQSLIRFIQSPETKLTIQNFGGYLTENTGSLEWI